MSATAAIQTAIYGVLNADATLLALATGGVHNDIPDGQAYPHVLISKTVETPWHTFGGPTSGLGWKDIVRIHTYSRYQGDKEALEIHNRIVSLLNFQPLSVSGYSASIVEYESLRVFVEDIEKIETRHLVTEFCVRVKQ
jgi:hypothetical protein